MPINLQSHSVGSDQGHRAGAGRSQFPGLRLGCQANLPPGIRDPQAEIHILDIRAKCLIENDPGHARSPQHQAATGCPLDLHHGIVEERVRTSGFVLPDCRPEDTVFRMSGEQIGHDGEGIGTDVEVVAADDAVLGAIRTRLPEA
jgi:hypothetical protein